MTESGFDVRLHPGLYTFLIKAVDVVGLRSSRAAWVMGALVDPTDKEVFVDDFDYANFTYPGSIEGGTVTGSFPDPTG